MKCFNYIKEKIKLDSTIVLTGKEYHYLVRVKRLKDGDSLYIRDFNNCLYLSKILNIGNDKCEIEILKRIEENQTNFSISIIQSALKGKKMDLVVRQATECGAVEIAIAESEHSILKMNDLSKKIERYSKIINEARQQSGSSISTTMLDPMKLTDIPKIDKNVQLGLFFHQVEIAQKQLAEYFNRTITKVVIVIGPEGGFSEREIEILQDKGYRGCYLGRNVLRAETAALYSIAAVQTIWRNNEL